MSWENNVRKVVPYVAGEQPEGKVIKLNTNEFPYAPSPMVATRIYDLAENEIKDETSMLRKYPNTNSDNLVNALSEVYNVDRDKIFVGVGSDDVLALSFLTFFNSDKPVLFPDITYSFYDVWASLFKIPFEIQPLKDDFTINKEDYFKTNGGIIIPNPNAPTGIMESREMFEEILKKNPDSVVIVDEAYVDFGADSMLPLIDKYDNLLVVQTFSKSRALAGLRIGVAFGNTKLISFLKDVKYSFNSYTINYPAIEIATAACRDTDYWKETVAKVIKTREWTKTKLKELGFEFADSKANFIFASHKTVPAEHIFTALKEKDIYVRFWNKARISNHLRITIGTDAEMEELIKSLKEIIENYA
ncbi:MAG: histidinol-phosphate transaminase [Lachnospiraceae bacterium]|nr:histidinol-phosphate transaminase [Lachnospiraceae bacterium]